MAIVPRCMVALSQQSLVRIRKILGRDDNDTNYDLSEAIDQILKQMEEGIDGPANKKPEENK